MNPRSAVFAFCLIFGILALFLTISVTAEDNNDNKPRETFDQLDLIDCKKIMGRIAKRTLKIFGRCTKELKANVTGNKEMMEKKLGCAIRCTLINMELVNEEGKITRERIQKFMDEMIPQDAHEFAHALSADCNESYGAKLDLSQEYCESYSEYAQCMMSTIGDFADKTNCHPGGVGGGMTG